jgi:predicted phosphodiesterase
MSVCFFSNAQNTQSNAADVKPALEFKCKPYLQNMQPTGVSVFWMMNNDCTSWLEYGETDQLGKVAYNSENGQIDACSEIQKIRLNDLTPGKTYYYRTASKGIIKYGPYNVVYKDTVYSPVHSFTLAQKNQDHFSFLLFADIHNQPAYIKDVVARENTVDFVIFNGDVVADISSDKQIYQGFLDKMSEFFAADKPFIYVRGNHETRGSHSRALFKYFDYPSNRYYDNLNYGNTAITFFDGGEDKDDKKYESYYGLANYVPYRKEQAQWYSELINTAAYKKKENKIVLNHIPIYPAYANDKEGGGDWFGANDLRVNFMPLFTKAKIDLMLAGHTHMPALLSPKETQTSYSVGITGSPQYEDKQSERRYMAYIVVEVNGSHITVTEKRPDGTLLKKMEVK